MPLIAATHISSDLLTTGENQMGHNGNRVLCNVCGTAVSDLHYK